MSITKIVLKGITSTLVEVEVRDEIGMVKLDNTSGKILEMWELSEEDIRQYLHRL